MLSAGAAHNGFVVRRVSELPRLSATAIELQHAPSGAQVLHVHAPRDPENLISIIFATPPEDDTGAPHILEHSVLAGSQRFRVKDPFFEMRKMSMATFLNAMTAFDCTYYPVASNVRKDFWNLAQVYWDAAFHPLLAERTFLREGHRLELSDRRDPRSPLLHKGIVYNEMKGYFSSPTSLLGRWAFRALMPDTIYARESGGDPDAIPQLTWEQLRRFHERFYQPANARIFLYGDIGTEEHVAFLGEKLDALVAGRAREAGQAPAAGPPALQPRWAQPRLLEQKYPIAPGDNPARRSYVAMNWLVGDSTDAIECLAMDVLDYILLGNEAAPLRRAIIESRLGEDLIMSGFRTGSRQSHFHVALQGTDPDARPAFESLVMHTLAGLAEKPMEPDRVEAAFQQLAFEYLEIGSQYPLQVMYRAMSMWMYGADPLALLRADELMAELQRRWRADPMLFGRLIRQNLLDNTHRLTMVLAPDAQLQAQRDANETERLATLRQSLSDKDIERLCEQADDLERAQNAPDDPANLAAMPQLAVSDLPQRPRHIPTVLAASAAGLEILRSDVPANGVNYLHVSFDLSALPHDLWAWLPLYGDCVRKLGAAGQDYIAIAQRVAAHTGGVGFSASAERRADDPASGVRRGTFTLRFVDDKAEQALALLRELIFDLDPRDRPRLREVLSQAKAAQRNAFLNAGISIALVRAARGFGPQAVLAEMMGGLTQMQLIQRLAAQPDSADQTIIDQLEQVRAHLRDGLPMTASFTGTPAVFDRVCRELESWRGRWPLRATAAPAALPEVAQSSRWEGLAGPMQVAHCALVGPAPHVSEPDAPLLGVGSNLLSSEYVLPEVRFKGTAYGGGCSYMGTRGLWQFHSYRDPWITRTLRAFAGSAAHVNAAKWSQLDVDRAIVGAAREAERPIRPGPATGTALWRHLLRDTPDRREARHTALLGARAGEVRRALAQALDRCLSDAAACVVSSREKLESANRDDPQRPLAIQDALA